MESPLFVEGRDAVVGMQRRLLGGVGDFWFEGRLVWPSREAIWEGSSAPHTAHRRMTDSVRIHICLDISRGIEWLWGGGVAAVEW